MADFAACRCDCRVVHNNRPVGRAGVLRESQDRVHNSRSDLGMRYQQVFLLQHLG